MYTKLNKFQNIYTVTYEKNNTSQAFLLVSKSLKAFSV